MEKEIICTICPLGCRITVKGEGDQIESVEGYSCPRGLTYAKNEFSHPVRILTTTVKLKNSSSPLLAVRSDKPIAKELIEKCMEQIKSTEVTSPVNRYNVVISDICGSGADIVATGSAK